MPNRAYASLWVRNFDETNMLSHFENFLATVPPTAGPVRYTELVIRAVDSTESPLEEYDLRAQALTPADIVELEQSGGFVHAFLGRRADGQGQGPPGPGRAW